MQEFEKADQGRLSCWRIFIRWGMERDIEEINCDFYNNSGDSFGGIPFKSILPAFL